MQFSKIIGQKAIKERLLRSVNEGRISHAQLFSGPSGVGKLAMAIAYAQYVSCEDKQEYDSCGVCISCRKYEKLIHPDLHFVFPVISTPKFDKAVSDNFIGVWRDRINEQPYLSFNNWLELIEAENKQGQISKFESDQILKKLSYKTFESDYKIMIIWLPEKMNHVASNRLLKILEEPPDKTIFLLVTQNQEMLLQTILSRTQIVSFPRIEEEALTEVFMADHGLTPEQTAEIVRVAEGSYLQALNVLNTTEESEINFERFTRFMRLCYQKKVIEINSWVDEMAGIGREKQKSFLTYGLGMVRESFILNSKQLVLSRLGHKEAAFCNKFSPFINQRNVAMIAQELNEAHYHIERNANAKLVFLDMALKIIKLLKM